MADILTTILSDRFKERFFAKVRKGGPGECWVWTANRTIHGYGQITLWDGKAGAAHRSSFIMHNGYVPEGLFVCHTCDNKLCVNPDHLYAGTREDNTRDAIERGFIRGAAELNAKKTHCKNGHELTLKPSGKWRHCVICKREDGRQRAEKRRRARGVLPGRRGAENAAKSIHLRSGENSSLAKLTVDDVTKIRQRRANGEKVIRIHADYPHMSYTRIATIAKGRGWKELTRTSP